MLVNRILKHGKKSLAYQIIYRALKKIQQKKKQIHYLFYVKHTWSNSRYSSKSKTKSTCHSLVIRGIPKASGSKYGFQIKSELVDAAKGSDDAIHKKEETHRMAEANRAFAHFVNP
ncbi:hypothetical protein GQ457_09G028710 [Hibiscus cannabinus]